MESAGQDLRVCDPRILVDWAAPTLCSTGKALRSYSFIKVVDGNVEVVSEGHWKPFTR